MCSLKSLAYDALNPHWSHFRLLLSAKVHYITSHFQFHHSSLVDCLKMWQQDHMPSSKQFNELASQKWNRNRLSCDDVQHPPVYSKLGLWIKGKDQTDSLAGKAIVTSGLHLKISETSAGELETLPVWEQSQEHHTINQLEERITYRKEVPDNPLWNNEKRPISIKLK